jgi:DNA-binding NtrC family response regulator
MVFASSQGHAQKTQIAIDESREFPHMVKNSAALHVLVVDDEPLIRWSMSETLSDLGYDVVEASDGHSAIGAVSGSTRPFDVILLDFRLPDSNDLTLLSTLRRLSPKTPIILMTAYGSAEILQGALDLGAFRVVGKPFEVDEIAALIREAHDARTS